MKNRILTFVIGVLTGAIIMSLVFLFIKQPINIGNMGNVPPKGNGQMQPPTGNMEEPPAKPNRNVEMKRQ